MNKINTIWQAAGTLTQCDISNQVDKENEKLFPITVKWVGQLL